MAHSLALLPNVTIKTRQHPSSWSGQDHQSPRRLLHATSPGGLCAPSARPAFLHLTAARVGRPQRKTPGSPGAGRSYVCRSLAAQRRSLPAHSSSTGNLGERAKERQPAPAPKVPGLREGAPRGGDKRQQQRAQTSSSSWLTRPKIAFSICCSPRSASRRNTRACSSAVRKWASRLSASEHSARASSPQHPGLGSLAHCSASATVPGPGAPSSPGLRLPEAAALRARSATIPSRLESQ